MSYSGLHMHQVHLLLTTLTLQIFEADMHLLLAVRGVLATSSTLVAFWQMLKKALEHSDFWLANAEMHLRCWWLWGC